MTLENLTLTIPTLNEEENISNCLSSFIDSGVKNIIVIDGGSDDETVNIIKKYNVKLIQLKKLGLANQRNIGISNVKTKYTALIDADMRSVKGSLEKMIQDLEEGNYDGVEAFIKPMETKSYYDKSYQCIMEININKLGKRNMIGTPTLWKTSVLQKNNFDPYFSGPSDDTDLCYRLSSKGHVFGGSSAIIKHVHRSDFKSYVKKYLWYGKGDAQFVLRHPERFFSILKHQLFNYPIKFSLISTLKLQISPIPFMIVSGLLRFFGMVIEIILKILKRKDRIYKT
jgi:glycosyltransferase involved in cell wall biosynthesis